jgi:hypothetical protein
MSDFSNMSDSDLLAALNKQPSAPMADLSKMSDNDLLMALNKHAEIPPPVGEDILKSAAIGVPKGIITGAGMPGDLSNSLASMSKKAGDYIGGMFGAEPSPPIGPPSLPTSDIIRKGVEQATGPLYEPKTPYGHIAETGTAFASNPFSYVGGGGVLAKAGTAAASGVTSEAAGQLSKGSPWEPIARLIGAIGGANIASIPRRVPYSVNPEYDAQIAAIRGEGIEPTAGQVRASASLRRTENIMPSIPGGPKGTNERVLGQFTQTALQRAGENSNRASQDVIDGAFTRIGGDFNRLTNAHQMGLDQTLAQDLTGTVGQYRGIVSPSNRAPVIDDTIRDIADMGRRNGGHLTGAQYNDLHSRLRRVARNTDDHALARTANDLAGDLDDAMERSISTSATPQDLGSFQTARDQYRNLLVIERAASMGGEEGARGFITPGSLAAAVKGVEGRRSFVRGTGDLSELARNGQAVLSATNSSGTAENANLLKVLGGEGLIGGLILGESPSLDEMLKRAAITAGAVALPAGIGHAVMSRPVQGFLKTQPSNSPNTIAILNAIRGR